MKISVIGLLGPHKFVDRIDMITTVDVSIDSKSLSR